MKKLLLVIALFCLKLSADAQYSSCTAFFLYSDSSLTVSFSDSSYGSTAPTTWNWSFGDGLYSTLQNPSHTFSAAGSYTVCLNVSAPFSNCQDTYCDTIVISGTVSCINPSQIDSSMVCTPVYSPVCGCDSVTYSNSCEAYYYGGVTSYTNGPCGTSGCIASYSYTPDSANSLLINFYDISYGNISDWTWDFGDGNTSALQNPSHTYANSGQYIVCLLIKDVINNCTDSICQTVYVDSQSYCYAVFTYTQDTVDPNTVFFSDYSYGNPVTWNWDFGDGNTSNLQNPSHTYLVDGNYLVCLTISDSSQACTDSICTYVYAGFQNQCKAYFTAYPDTADPFTYFFNDYSLGNPASWLWDFGDGGTSNLQNPLHIYTAPGTYQVCLFIADSSGACTDSLCDYVMVIDPVSCNAAFTYSVSGWVNTFVTFTDSSSGNPTSWFWDFGDGNTSTQQNPFNNYADTGTYNVCLTITDSAGYCFDTYCEVVYIGTTPPVCTANFTYSMIGNVVSFSDLSSGTVSNYGWTFGDGSLGQGPYPVHTYTDSGYFNVCLTITDFGSGCFNTFCDSIYIAPSSGGCSAYFIYSTFGDSVQFADASTGSPVAWDWDFGDFQSSNQPNPGHTYNLPFSFTYTACLTVSTGSGCYDTYCDTIVIVGLEEKANNSTEIIVFPNPSKGFFTVSMKDEIKGWMEIYNITGELVQSTEIAYKTSVINMRDKAEGLYFLNIIFENSAVQKKLMLVK